MHIPASTIRRIRREKGQDRSKKGKIFSPDINEFMEMYDHYNGIISRVAEYYGVDRHKVAEYAREIGIKTDRKLGITDAEKDKIVSMYNSMSAKKVAEIYGVSESYISALWSRRGLAGKEIRVYKIDQSVFDEIDSELKAYFLGFLLLMDAYINPQVMELKINRIYCGFLYIARMKKFYESSINFLRQISHYLIIKTMYPLKFQVICLRLKLKHLESARGRHMGTPYAIYHID